MIYYVRVISEAYVRASSEEEAREIAGGLYNEQGAGAHAVRPPQAVIGVWGDRHALAGRNEKP